MPYIGQPPVSGDTTKSFRLLDNLASFTLTFDATSSSVVDTTANTLTFANHRFVTAQRVTYTDGGGTAIGGLSDGTAYFVIKVDQNTIQLASSASNANNNTAISLSAGAAGGSHTLNIAFDGTNTKFKVTYGNGTKAKISRAGQLLISINGVLQQAQESSTPTLGFGLDSDSTIVFSQAPVSTDVLFGQILADTITNFDTQDNTLDVFTGDGNTTGFTLSKKPASNNDILVTLDGVVQYPTTTSTSNAYSVSDNTLTFTSAPANGVAIQVRHIGFAGATSSAVTGLYGRTGNVTLSSSDDDITVGNVTAGIITATSYGSISGTTASFSGNVSIGGTLTYEDVTNIDSVGLITARSGIVVTGGSVGIGLVNPEDKLHVKSGKIRIENAIVSNNDSTIAYDNDTFIIDVDPNNVRGSSAFKVNVDTVNGLIVDENRRVGLGTQVPGALLSLESTAANAAKIRLGFDGSRYYDIFRGSTTNSGYLNFYGSQSTFVGYVFGGVDGEWARIDTSGRLLLGTTTEGNAAADNLTVAGSAACGISIRSGTSSNGALYFSDGTSGNDEYRGYLIYEHNTNVLRFATDATERMRIDAQGRLILNNGAGSSDNSIFRIEGGTSGASIIEMGDANDLNIGEIRYDQGSNSMRFTTNASENMRIDSSGRLLVGTTTSETINGDNVNLQIKSTGASAGLSIHRSQDTTSPPYINLAHSRAGAIVSNGDNLGAINFFGHDGTDLNSLGAAINCQVDDTPGSNDMPGRLVFSTTANNESGPTERMRIDSKGRVSIGDVFSEDYANTRLWVNGYDNLIVSEGNSTGYTEGAFKCVAPSNNRGGGIFMFNSNGGSTTTQWFAGRPYSASDQYIIARSTGVNIGQQSTAQTSNQLFSVYSDGDATLQGTLTESGSDDKLKKNRTPLTSALDKVKTLEGFTYNWNDDAINNYGFSSDEGTLVGMSAQELQSVLPEAVKTVSQNKEVSDPTSGDAGEKQEYLTIQYGRVVPLLVEAIKELSAKVAALEG